MLDLFCGAGGASVGYHRAGFEVVGVDIRRQPRYPYRFVRADAMTMPLSGFDAIHASPPCQAYSQAGAVHNKVHPDLVGPIRDRLIEQGTPWVIENVMLAPVRPDLLLCGTMFGLDTIRHRLFESSLPLGLSPTWCNCRRMALSGQVFNLHNAAQRKLYMETHGYTSVAKALRESLGVTWMSMDEAQEAIPPAYTEFIGRRLMEALS